MPPECLLQGETFLPPLTNPKVSVSLIIFIKQKFILNSRLSLALWSRRYCALQVNSNKIKHTKQMNNPTGLLPAHVEHSQPCTGYVLCLHDTKRRNTFQMNAVCFPVVLAEGGWMTQSPSSFLPGWRLRRVFFGSAGERAVFGIFSDNLPFLLLSLQQVAWRACAVTILGGFPAQNREPWVIQSDLGAVPAWAGAGLETFWVPSNLG